MTRHRKEPILTRPATADADCIRVRLNPTTLVMLKSMKSFASWKKRYPLAEIREPVADGNGPDEGPAGK